MPSNETYDWESYELRSTLIQSSPCCVYCNTPLTMMTATLDHLIPKSKGGDEVVLACRPCNLAKADKLPLEYVWVRG